MKKTALYFGYYGVHYTGAELKEAFQTRMADKKAKAGQNYECFPDLPVEPVFAELFRRRGITENAAALGMNAAQLFRIASTDHIRLYPPHVTGALTALQEKGYRLWLLSNAQRVFSAFKLAELNYTYQHIATELNRQPIDYGTGELYTPVEVHTVTRIELNPGITASRIAVDTMRTKSAVSQTVARLESKGLIRREKDPVNGRRQLLYVTDKGLQLSRCHRAYDEENVPLDQLVALFGPDVVDKFADMMEFLICHSLEKIQKHNFERNED